MNSILFEESSRDYLALHTAENLKKLYTNTVNTTALVKELLEVNLSLTAYIEESKARLEELRLNLGHAAKSSQEVVEIFTEK